MILEQCSDCFIREDNLAEICEKHYSKHMAFPMECKLITTKANGLRILRELGVQLVKQKVKN